MRGTNRLTHSRNLIMPGFKNAHTHSAMTFLRSHADDMKLDEWLNDKSISGRGKTDRRRRLLADKTGSDGVSDQRHYRRI